MKLGNAVFYTMESSRGRYLASFETWPYLAGVLSIFYFVGFALKVPMHAKLYKETGYSAMLGLATACLYPYYYKRVYITNVETVYEDLRLAISRNPKLAKPDDTTAINKNFGPSKWNTNESGMDTDEDIEMDNSMSIFDGKADDDRKMVLKTISECA